MHASPGRVARVLLGIACLGAPAAAGVLVVSASGGDFTHLQAAIDAAADGDVILVRPTGAVNLLGCLIDGKSLSVVGDVPVDSTTKLIAYSLVVRNLAAGQQVVVRNFKFVSVSNYSGGFYLKDNAGSVWIENCEAEGLNGLSQAPFGCGVHSDIPGEPGIDAIHCDAVTVVGCVVRGGRGVNAYDNYPFHDAGLATDGGPAIRLQSSLLAVYQSSLTGGKGGEGHLCTEMADGGLGIDAFDSMVFLSGCTVTGGVQGAGPPTGTPGGGVRGDAISTFERLDTVVLAAPGGVDFATSPGAVTTYSGVARSFRVTSPMREGESGTLAMQGVQGDFVGFFWSFENAMLPMPARNGWFLLNAPFIAGPFLIGSITDAGGVWDFPFPAPLLPPAMEARSFLLQAWFQYPGGVTLGSGTAFTLLDAAF